MNSAKQENIEVKIGMCSFCGHDECHVTAIIKDGKLSRLISTLGSPIKPLPPVEGCPKARSAPEFVHHPDRLNFPLKRIGERGENKWKTITWDQALDEIAEKLKNIKEKYGAEAVAAMVGPSSEGWAGQRFFNIFGSPNYESGNSRVCKGDLRSVHFALYGRCALYGPPTDRCRCVVQWGSHHSATGCFMYNGEKRVKDMGGKTICIDPRKTKEAEEADIWLQIRPGTDGALAMGWLNVIINEELYDKEFVNKWTVGFDKLKERVQEYNPKKVAEITWLSSDKIVESARMYATTKPASINWGTKCSHIGPNSTEVEHSRAILRAITGNLDIDGGDLMLEPNPGVLRHVDLELAEEFPEKKRSKTLGTGVVKLKSWEGWKIVKETRAKYGLGPIGEFSNTGAILPWIYDAILTDKPYPVKALILPVQNSLLNIADTKKVYEAHKKVELSVVLDLFMTPTAMISDYVLPGTSWYEHPHINWTEHIDLLTGADAIMPKFKPGEFDRKNFYDLWYGLGIRLGQKEYWPWETLEEAMEYRLSPSNITWKEFSKRPWGVPAGIKERRYEEKGFFTPSGKVELYSSVYERLGYDPLPFYEEPPESPISTPELAKKYPYILINSRERDYRHSMGRMLPSIRKRHPDPLVQINPETAKKLGIEEGDWVWIHGVRGRIKQKCKYFDGIHPQVVNCELGWWFPEKSPEEPSLFGVWESNINVLSSLRLEHCDPRTGGWYMNAMLCNIYKVQEGDNPL